MALEKSKLYDAVKSNDLDEVEKLIVLSDQENLREDDGENILHVAIKSNAKLEIFKALLDKVDFTQRNCNGDTVFDLILDRNESESADLVNEKVTYLLETANEKRIEELALAGWESWPVSPSDLRPKTEEGADYLEKIMEFQEKVRSVHEAIFKGELRNVVNLLDRTKIIQAQDKTGLLPLQKAVILDQMDIVEEIIKLSKESVNLTDNYGRTALHYAGATKEVRKMYVTLKEAGADETIKDMAGRIPDVYVSDPSLLQTEKILQRVREISEKFCKPKSRASSRPTSSQSFKPCTPQKNEKVTMYISQNLKNRKDVPTPETIDAKYLAEHMGQALTVALAEIAERRPWDPIEYLAQWLYKYKENIDHIQSQEKLFADIQIAEAEQEKEMEEKRRRLDEQRRIEHEEKIKQEKEEEEERKRKEQEELQRKAREAALAKGPQLPTVSEEGEEDISFMRERDENGQTELHKLASQKGADLVAVINLGFSPADRDGENKTARDIADEHNLPENVETIDNYISNMIEQENYDNLEQLLYDSYDKLSTVIDNVSTEGLPEEVNKFISSIPQIQYDVKNVFKTAQEGSVPDMQKLLENKKLALAKDVYGRSPLHVAVLYDKNDLVEYIITDFPNTVKCRDNMNRTPLHYAMAVSEEIASLLTEQNASETAEDAKHRAPRYYRDEKSDILQMRTHTDDNDADHNSDHE